MADALALGASGVIPVQVRLLSLAHSLYQVNLGDSMDFESEEFIEALRVIEAFAENYLDKYDDADFLLMKPIKGGSVVIEVNRSVYNGDPRLN